MASIARVANPTGSAKASKVIGCVFIVKRDKSTNITTTNYKRGTGGRSSFSGIVATIFGGKSTLGFMTLNRLARVGSQIIVPYRGDPHFLRDMKLMGDLGQVLFNRIDLKDEVSIRNSLQYSNVVINCIGTDYETSGFTFHDVHVKGPRLMAKMARECGVERFIHVSDLNAGRESRFFLKGGSQYLKTKLEGEMAVREEFPDAIVMRPSVFVDINDRFTYYYTSKPRIERMHYPFRIPLLALPNGGADLVKIPVLPKDVATGIVNAVSDPQAPGQTYQCVGPYAYHMKDLVNHMFTSKGQKWALTDNTQRVAGEAKLREKIYRKVGTPKPTLVLDKLERESVSDEVNPELPTLRDLGVEPTAVENIIEMLLTPSRRRGIAETDLDDAIEPVRPKRLQFS